MGGRTTCWPFGAVYAPKERSSRAHHRPRHRATSPLARLMRFAKNVCRLVCEIPVPPSRNQWSEIPGAGHAERAAVRAAAWAYKGVDDVSTRTRRLLLVPVQGGKRAHPRQRRAEPVLPAWDKITALAQDSHPYHVGCLLPLPRRGRIDWRAAARTECLQAWIAALGRGLEVCRRLARYAKGRTGNGNIDAEGGAGADLAIRAVANRGLLGVRFAFDPDVAAVARAVDFHGSFLFLRQAQPSLHRRRSIPPKG